MSLNNFVMVIRMLLDKNVRNFFKRTHEILKDDINYSRWNTIKSLFVLMKNEKIIKVDGKYRINHFLAPIPSEAIITNLNAVKDVGNNIYSQHCNMERSAPASFYLCLTNACPFNCKFCSMRDRINSTKELTTEEWKKVLKDIQDMNTPIIGFSGGEPLLRNDLIELCKEVDDKRILSIFTSGYGLTYEKAKELKEAGVYILGISIPSNFEDTDRTKLAISAMKISNSSGLHTIAHIVVLKKDIDEKNLFKLFKMLKSNGIKEVRIFEPILSGKLMCMTGTEILHEKEDREKLNQICFKANKSTKYPKIGSDPYNESHEKFGCGAGVLHSYLSANGDLYPCDFLPIPFGNIREKSISELWEEMKTYLNKPQKTCLAQRVNIAIKKGKTVSPKNIDESIDICENHIHKGTPRIYQQMEESINDSMCKK